MFDSEDDSEDEEKVHEGSLSKAQGVSHGKAPPGILVSAICAPACCCQCAVRQGHHGRAQGPFFASRVLQWILLTLAVLNRDWLPALPLLLYAIFLSFYICIFIFNT